LTRYIEDKIDDIERKLALLREKHDRTLPKGIDARIERLEAIVDFLFKKAFSALQREGLATKLDADRLKKRKPKPIKRKKQGV
jgi:DNA-binding protein H-NS